MLSRALCLIGVIAAPAIAIGDPAEPSAEAAEQAKPRKPSHREINGHFFIPSLIVSDPFVATVFSLQSASGVAWVDGPSFDPRGNESGRDSYVASALFAAFSFQANVLPWLALRLGGGGGLFGGFNAKSALVLGATMPLDVAPGATVSWRIGKHVRLGGTFDFDYQHSRVVDPLAAVRRSVELGQADSTQVRQSVSTYTVVPGLALAFAPHAALGFVAAVQYLWTGRDDGPSTTHFHNLVFGVVAQLDLKPLFAKVPLGIVVAYRPRIPLNSDDNVAHDLEGGIYYTGRDALVLGLVLQGRWFDLRPRFETSVLLSNFVIRYYWN